MTELAPATHKNIIRAARVLREGGLVAFPTETVYGLGANALDEQATKRIFTAKGRPTEDPLIVHLSGIEQVEQVVQQLPPLARRLAERFWPGPLTLVLPKRDAVPPIVTAGLGTVAVRVPSHAVALALIREAGLPIAAPSANRFGHTSPTTAQHVFHDLKGRVDIILDDGPTPVGVESTVLDVCAEPPRILRPGGVTREMLEQVIGPVTLLTQTEKNSGGLPSPGLLDKHYAPRAELFVFMGEQAPAALQEHLRAARQAGKQVGVLALDVEADILEQEGAIPYRLGADLQSVARRIYAGMRWLDAQGVDLILCRDFGESGLGLAIRDRLRRAAARVVE